MHLLQSFLVHRSAGFLFSQPSIQFSKIQSHLLTVIIGRKSVVRWLISLSIRYSIFDTCPCLNSRTSS